MYNILNTTMIASAKVNRNPWNEFLLSIFAGILVGFGCIGVSFIRSDTPMLTSLSGILAGFIFSFSLFAVFRLGLELFTGNVVFFSVVMEKRLALAKYAKLLGVNLLGNLVGCLIVALVFIPCNLSYMHMLQSIAQTKTYVPPIMLLFRGIMCGMLFSVFSITQHGSIQSSSKFLSALCVSVIFWSCGFEHDISDAFLLMTNLLQNIQMPVTMVMQGFVAFLMIVVGNVFGGLIMASLYFAANNYARTWTELD